MTGGSIFRSYLYADKDACLELFDANCPDFFAPNERMDYLGFLASVPTYYKICIVNNQIVGAFGLNLVASNEGSLKWILVDPPLHGRGIGSAIMEHVFAEARATGLQRIRIAASHKSAPFFARFGAKALLETRDGWGPGMHRVDMELRLI